MRRVRKTDRDLHDLDDEIVLTAIGRWMHHAGMHNGTIPIERDEYGRCKICVALGFWRADA
jgi:hypothetical protein